jgi:hypothetical protein
MTPPFLLLLAAAGIFRFLSADCNKTFRNRLARLLPRNVAEDHLRVLIQEFPDRLAEFRRRAVPFSTLHVALNAASCICFVAALWYFPPSAMQHWDLIFMRYGSLVLTPVAFIADVVLFTRMVMASFSRGAEAGGAA